MSASAAAASASEWMLSPIESLVRPPLRRDIGVALHERRGQRFQIGCRRVCSEDPTRRNPWQMR